MCSETLGALAVMAAFVAGMLFVAFIAWTIRREG